MILKIPHFTTIYPLTLIYEKVGNRIKELERIKGIHQGNGSNQHEQKPNNSDIAYTQEDLAKEFGMSVDTLNNYKKLSEMIPDYVFGMKLFRSKNDRKYAAIISILKHNILLNFLYKTV